MKAFTHRLLALALVLFGASSFLLAQTPAEHDHAKMMKTAAAEFTVIDLDQVPGAFGTQELTLKPGKYQFRVANVGVDHPVGFVIQPAADAKGDLMKTALPTSFTAAAIETGTSQLTGIVDLKAGEYVYSCPLNPTPHYPIHVVE